MEAGGATSTTLVVGQTQPTATTAPTGTSHEPQSTTSTTIRPVPRTLAGRVAYVTNDGSIPLTAEIGSMLPDGTDRRIEDLSCPPGGALGGAMGVSPDGTQILRDCGSSAAPNASAEGYGLVIQDVATGHRRTLVAPGSWGGGIPPTQGQYRGFASWSPDGRKIVVGSSRPVLGVIDVATGAIKDIPTDGTDSWAGVSWSPDGTRLLTGGLKVLDLATGTVTDHSSLLPPFPAGTSCDSQGGTWGPDGAIYVQQNLGCIEPNVTRVLYRVNMTTGVTTTVVRQSGYIDNIVFLPGGRILIRDGTDTALTIGTDGSNPVTFPLPWPISGFVAPRGTGT